METCTCPRAIPSAVHHLSYTADPGCLLDADGTILFVNAAWERIALENGVGDRFLSDALVGTRWLDPVSGDAPRRVHRDLCDFSGKRSEVHNHLAENHGDTLGVRVDEFTKHTFYVITCPVCGASYEQVTKKARRDPSFVLEYEHEIRMVVFDLPLYHLQGEHQLGE